MGFLITLEGVDGAGKSSHIGTISAWFERRGFEVLATREPGGTPLAERIRELFLVQGMDALSEALLVFAARNDHLRSVIEPALARGVVVICDRFTDASFAYQGGGRGLDESVLQGLETWVQRGLQPDLTLWFDLDPETAAARRAQARAADRLEREDIDFFRRVGEGYARRARAEPGRIARVDAEADRERVRIAIEDLLAGRSWT